jgi:hypothetical protein
MLAFLKRIAASFRMGLDRRDEWTAFQKAAQGSHDQWLEMQQSISKNIRLAMIARERNLLKDELAKAIKQKKARAPIYAKLRALSVEELNVVAGR